MSKFAIAAERLALNVSSDNQEPSFRAKARSAAVEESPSSRPDDSLSGRLRFLDSLRSLGMTLTAYDARRSRARSGSTPLYP